MARTVFTNGLVFDGSGSAPAPGEVIVDGDRVVEVRAGWSFKKEETDQIVDATGCTVMPGLIESHAHLTFPSAVGHIDPSFNPPLDVSFFHHIEGLPTELARAERNARILLDAGFTSAYSAGSLLPMPVEVILRDKIKAGAVPGPRMRAASMERDNHPVRPDGHTEPDWQGPDACRRWVHDMAKQGYDSVKFLLSNDDVFTPGGSQITQYTQEEANAAGEAAREAGVWLNCHAQSAESVKMAVRAGFRSIYHCTYADEEGLDLLESVKDTVFVSPAPGIIYANVHEGEEFGITREVALKMGSVDALEGMAAVYPEIRKRGIRALPGGDYGFPNNPIGRNARDLELFVDVLGYTPLEVLTAATKYGGELLDLGDIGMLKPSWIADVLVVRGNPAEDVRVLQNQDNLIAIMQAGRFHKAPA
ncbi:imidazolonepropionase-like amidohydrolase [Actinoplanes lutulentus]|uniref:Imidazolonepropionase-like amidohydrolase n=1 Tax=Actinoplanes lutulentus TaxID=1287878 RepID=A0A327YVC4_9ACTN|nr:amidohydrolase family protein [Actinoplanes lutulentus]MBB2947129.1 imidazolonepropionase-like amidohydrolase [Actinoplanes lutulentus]RAK24665.1 imidazolonepropionase-like amidohydrolase [Actinoplanes lutulentus]